MSKSTSKKRELVYSLEAIPAFATEAEEGEWWETHDLAPELGKDVTAEQQALIRRLQAKHPVSLRHDHAQLLQDLYEG